MGGDVIIKVGLGLSCPSLDVKSWGLHAFRRFGATIAKLNGLPNDIIKLLGRWHSDTFLGYFVFSIEEQINLQSNLLPAVATSIDAEDQDNSKDVGAESRDRDPALRRRQQPAAPAIDVARAVTAAGKSRITHGVYEAPSNALQEAAQRICSRGQVSALTSRIPASGIAKQKITRRAHPGRFSGVSR